ncbi:hypothetical protein Cgig2_017707 [Carnegiea gigantea]|uniref:Uncharacterized protein n=1 Tax=Carnegiea gigantea TaxID=171969 RepID=A0A9Q1K2U2_9CARY|nr:hypothetical protein Cgig2_017707 [Carnegiea gigantea]
MDTFLSSWLRTFILPAKDAGCIHFGTFNITSFMASSIGYCIPMTIFVSIHKGLNEISSSLHPGRSGANFLVHFLHTWLVKELDTYKLEARPSLTNFHQDAPVNLDFNNFPNAKTMLCYHHVLTRYGTGSQKATNEAKKHFRSLPVDGQDKLLIVCELTTKMVIELPPKGVENIMDILGVDPNLTKCIRESGNVNFNEGLFLCHWEVSICFPKNDEAKSTPKAHALLLVPYPLHSLRARQEDVSIFNVDVVIEDVNKNVSQAFGPAILNKVSGTPFDGLPSFKGDIQQSFTLIVQREIDITPLESKVERLVKQACDLKDLQQNYSGQTTTEEQDSCHIEVQGKLDEASRQLDAKGAR